MCAFDSCLNCAAFSSPRGEWSDSVPASIEAKPLGGLLTNARGGLSPSHSYAPARRGISHTRTRTHRCAHTNLHSRTHTHTHTRTHANTKTHRHTQTLAHRQTRTQSELPIAFCLLSLRKFASPHTPRDLSISMVFPPVIDSRNWIHLAGIHRPPPPSTTPSHLLLLSK